MLTHKQLLWFNDGEKTAMENWYGAGNRGKPWSKVVTFDSKKFRRVGEVAKGTIEEKVEEGVIPLRGFFPADTAFFAYVGLTCLPYGGQKWMTQADIGELLLNGGEQARRIGKALFIVASEGEDHLYVVVNKYKERETSGRLRWESPLYSALPVEAVRRDEMLISFAAATGSTLDMNELLDGVAGTVSSLSKGDMPKEMFRAGLARAAAQDLVERQFQVTVRKEKELELVWTDLEKLGVQFYGENDG